MYCILSGQSLVFSFWNEKERKLDARFLDKTGVVYRLQRKTELKPTKSSYSPKKRNTGRTKYTRYTVLRKFYETTQQQQTLLQADRCVSC